MRQHVWVRRVIEQTFRASCFVKRGAISCYEVSVTIRHECYVFSGTSGVINLTQSDVEFRDVEKVEFALSLRFGDKNCRHLFSLKPLLSG